MTKAPSVAPWRLWCSAIPMVAALFGCGTSDFRDHGDKRSSGDQEELGGVATTPNPCMYLGNSGQTPGQHPVPVGPGQEPNPPFPPPGPVPPPPGPVPPPPGPVPPCVTGPGQPPPPCVKDCIPPPCAVNCGTPIPPPPCGGCQPPPPCNTGCENPWPIPFPIPLPMPVQPGQCGQPGVICDLGPTQQWPGQFADGKPFDHDDFASCLNSFHAAGVNTQGQWAGRIREFNGVNVLGTSTFVDASQDHAMIIVKMVGVLGRTDLRLLNPHALYCVKDVQVLSELHLQSCFAGNVVFGNNVRVLSQDGGEVVTCP